jgi:hypothetical protein
MHSGLDYILEDADLESALRSLRRCLRRGGLLAFDKCLDEPGFYRDDYSDSRELSCGRADFQYRWDRRRRMLEQICVVTRNDGPKPVQQKLIYHMRATPPQDLLAMAMRSGFMALEPPKQFTIEDPGMGVFRAI